MKDWIYFYIEHTIKYGVPFYKEVGWSLGLKNNYVVLSGMLSWSGWQMPVLAIKLSWRF